MTGGPVVPTLFSDKQVEAAAKAWLEWQFDGQKWETASDSMKAKFLDGARVILSAAVLEGMQFPV
jgi:hypothetical protein